MCGGGGGGGYKFDLYAGSCAGGGFMKVWDVSMDQCNCINARTVQSHYDRDADVLLFSVRKKQD